MKKRILLSFRSPELFSQALLNCLVEGHTPVLSANLQPQTLSQALHEVDDHWSEGDVTFTTSLQDAIQILSQTDPSQEIILFTSGSSAQPRPIVKKLKALMTEVEVIDSLLRPQAQGNTVYATVSHQHIYGLLFSILWPLATGKTMGLRPVSYPSDLLALETKKPYTLITSPAFLKRCDIKKKLKNCRLIVSSGGSLSDEVAGQTLTWSKTPPVEFYGSTETGGVAYRQHTARKNTPWSLLPGVEVRHYKDQPTVDSPFLDEPTVLHDVLEFVEQRKFHLLGRSDRIVKIEEKRVSLDQMEFYLCQMPEVTDVCVVPQETAQRQTLVCILALSSQGLSDLKNVGRLEFKARIREQLSRYYEPVVVPRSFRYVEKIPRNSQSKVQLSEVKRIIEEYDPA